MYNLHKFFSDLKKRGIGLSSKEANQIREKLFSLGMARDYLKYRGRTNWRWCKVCKAPACTKTATGKTCTWPHCGINVQIPKGIPYKSEDFADNVNFSSKQRNAILWFRKENKQIIDFPQRYNRFVKRCKKRNIQPLPISEWRNLVKYKGKEFSTFNFEDRMRARFIWGSGIKFCKEHKVEWMVGCRHYMGG